MLSGCGSGDAHGRITGKVTFQGQAVSEGSVLFNNNEKGIHMTAELKPDGSYEVLPKFGGLPVGTYRVCIRPPDVPLPPLGSKAAPEIKQYPNIPPKYRDDKISGLSLTVKEGENPFDIAM